MMSGGGHGADIPKATGMFVATKLAKRAVTLAPFRRQSNGWANLVVGVMLSAGPFPRLTFPRNLAGPADERSSV